MVTKKIKHIKVKRPLLRGATIAASTSKPTSPIDLGDVERLALTVRAKYNASASSGITCYLYTTPNDKDWDTDELTSFEPSFAAGSVYQKTAYIDPDAQELRCKITNKDGTYSVSEVDVTAILTMEELEDG